MKKAKYMKDDISGEIINIRIITEDSMMFIPIDKRNPEYIETMELVDKGQLTIEDPD